MPPQDGAHELFCIIRTRRAGRWWYLCCGLDQETNPFCLLSTKLPNQDKISSIEPETISDEALGWILHTKACLDLAKADDFEGFLLTWKRPHHYASDSETWFFLTSDGKSPYDITNYHYHRLDVTISRKEEAPRTGNFKFLYDVDLSEGADPEPSAKISTESRFSTWMRRFKELTIVQVLLECLGHNVKGWALVFVYIVFTILLGAQENRAEKEVERLRQRMKELEDRVH